MPIKSSERNRSRASSRVIMRSWIHCNGACCLRRAGSGTTVSWNPPTMDFPTSWQGHNPQERHSEPDAVQRRPGEGAGLRIRDGQELTAHTAPMPAINKSCRARRASPWVGYHNRKARDTGAQGSAPGGWHLRRDSGCHAATDAQAAENRRPLVLASELRVSAVCRPLDQYSVLKSRPFCT
jgi:hypothetical protein